MDQPTLRCRQVRRVLQSYLDGELENVPAELVADHLAACRRCGVEAETISRVIDRIRALRPDVDLAALVRSVDTVDDLLQDG